MDSIPTEPFLLPGLPLFHICTCRSASLLGTIMPGDFMKECGVVSRFTKASENEIANIITLLLGISVVATMDGKIFLMLQTLILFGLGFLAIWLDTICVVWSAKRMRGLTGSRINLLIGERQVFQSIGCQRGQLNEQGQKYNTKNYLLMHAMGASIGG